MVGYHVTVADALLFDPDVMARLPKCMALIEVGPAVWPHCHLVAFADTEAPAELDGRQVHVVLREDTLTGEVTVYSRTLLAEPTGA